MVMPLQNYPKEGKINEKTDSIGSHNTVYLPMVRGRERAITRLKVNKGLTKNSHVTFIL